MAALELEHAIGFNGLAKSPLHLHPAGNEVLYAQGGCVVIADLRDPHKQAFLRGHDDSISCLALSAPGRLVVSGQAGENADVVVWDFESKREVYRLQEHDHGITVVEISEDERFLLTIGADAKLVVWDLLTGCIVSSKQGLKQKHVCACWGGRKRDVKRRLTTEYQIATGGPAHLTYWTFDPMGGTLVAEECTFGNQVRSFMSVTFSADGDYVFAGSESSDFAAVHVKHKVMHATTPAVSGGVLSIVAVAHEMGDRVIVGGGDGSISVFDATRDGANNVRAFSRGPAHSSVVSVAGGAAALVLASEPGAPEIRVLCGTTQGCLYAVTLHAPTAAPDATSSAYLLQEAHHAAVTAVAYPPDPTGQSADASTMFATASEDGTLRVWDVSDYKVLAKGVLQPKVAGKPCCLAFTGEVMFSGWSDGKVRAHEAEKGSCLWAIDDCHRCAPAALPPQPHRTITAPGPPPPVLLSPPFPHASRTRRPVAA